MPAPAIRTFGGFGCVVTAGFGSLAAGLSLRDSLTGISLSAKPYASSGGRWLAGARDMGAPTQLIWSRFADFTLDELYAALAFRQAVLVVEQNSAYADLDA